MIIKNNKTNLSTIMGKTLIPGNNTVDLSWWMQARKHPTVQARLELGLLEEVTPIEDVTEENEAGELTATKTDAEAKQYSVNMIKDIKQVGAANALIRDTFHPVLLQAWLEVEGRAKVKEAIEKQLKLLKQAPEKLDRSKARQVSTGGGVDVIELTATPSAQDD